MSLAPPSALFLDALRFPHEAVISVRVYRGGAEITPARFTQWGQGLPITDGGTVTIDVTSQVRRVLNITIADAGLHPTGAQQLLDPTLGTELAVSRGIKYPNGKIDWVPVGLFRIETTTETPSGQSGPTGIDVTANDRSAYIVDGRFFIPTKSVGDTVVAEIEHLTNNVMPPHTPAMVDLSNLTNPCPKQVYDDKDRIGALLRLAASINCEFFVDPTGTPTLRHLKKPSDPADWTVDVGSTGVMLDLTPASDRTDIFNGVVCTGERADGTPAGWSVQTDDDPTSPTLWGGPFGKKPVFFSSPTLSNTAQCAAAAQGLLERYRGTGWSLTLDAMVNPLLEGGDVIVVVFPDGRIQRHLIDTITMPLDMNSPMNLTTHTNDPGGDV